MHKTSILGDSTSGSGSPEIFVLGYAVPGYPAQTILVGPSCSISPPFFTARLGICQTVPSHIELGVAYERIRSGLNLTGSVNFLTLFLPFKAIFPFSNALNIIVQIRKFFFKVIQRNVSQLDTNPPSIDVSSTGQEQLPLNIDFTNYLQSGETLISASPILRIASNKTTISTGTWQAGVVVVVGNVAQVTLVTQGLQLNQNYELLLTGTTSNNRKMTAILSINVVA